MYLSFGERGNQEKGEPWGRLSRKACSLNIFMKESKLIPAVLLLSAVIVYNLNFRNIPTGDTFAAAVLPFKFILSKNFYLDEFYTYYGGKPQISYFKDTLLGSDFSKHFDPNNIVFSRGHWMTTTPLALPIIISPLYLPVVFLFSLENAPLERIVFWSAIMEKLCSSLIASFSVLVLFLILREFVSLQISLLLSLAYAYGTSTWTIASQALWQHGPSQLFVLLTFLFLLKANRNVNFLYLAGLTVSIASMVRYSNGIFAFLVLVYVLSFHREGIWRFILPATLVILPNIVYNLYCFQRVTGGSLYSAAGSPSAILMGLAGLLVSPNRGLFVYSPFLIFSFYGIWKFFKMKMYKEKPLFLCVAIAIIGHLLLIGFFSGWYGGFCYGPRYLTDTLPFLMLFFLLVVEQILKKKMLRFILTVFLVYSIFVQAIGAFFYPMGKWDSWPRNVVIYPERVWDWKDNQISRELLAGLGPKFTEEFHRIVYSWYYGFPRALPNEAFRAEYIVFGRLDTRLSANQVIKTHIVVVNRSNYTWVTLGDGKGRYKIYLSYRWVDEATGKMVEVEPNKVSLPYKLSPDQKAGVILPIKTPPYRGNYFLEVSLFQEGVGWFSDRGVNSFLQKIEIQ